MITEQVVECVKWDVSKAAEDVQPKFPGIDYFKLLSVGSIGLIFLHVATIFGVFFVPYSWDTLLLCYFSTIIRGWFVSAGYHRYFSHRSFSTSRIFQFIMGVIACSSFQRGPLWWASHHRYHHRYADTDSDVHSPTKKGFLWAHVWWTLLSKTDEVRINLVPDLKIYPELVYLEKFNSLPGILLIALLYYFGGFVYVFWGFIVSTTIIFEISFCINSVTHMFGSERFKLNDTSKNNYLLGIIALGEGFHNNHHAYARSAKVGLYWWEPDVVYYGLWCLEKLGIVWNLKRPNLKRVGEYI